LKATWYKSSRRVASRGWNALALLWPPTISLACNMHEMRLRRPAQELSLAEAELAAIDAALNSRARKIYMGSGLWEDLLEVVQAVMPITLVVVLLQVTVISMPLVTFLRFLIGALMVMLGLLLFLRGVKTGLLPIGEIIGAELPKRGSLSFILLVAFFLGLVVTIAEPDVRVLAHQADLVSGGRIGKTVLVLTVALGVGIFVCLAMLRIIVGIPIAWLFAGGYLTILVLSFFTSPDFVPISFDAGGVTTGPVTVPFILALGIGTATVLGGRSSLDNSFGLVGLASIGPVLGVMILGMIYK